MKIKLEEFGNMDLTAIEKPFGLLDKATQEALKSHGGPYQLYNSRGFEDCFDVQWIKWQTYRVKPQPKVVTRYIYPEKCETSFLLGITHPAKRIEMQYDTVDGVINLESIRFKEVK